MQDILTVFNIHMGIPIIWLLGAAYNSAAVKRAWDDKCPGVVSVLLGNGLVARVRDKDSLT